MVDVIMDKRAFCLNNGPLHSEKLGGDVRTVRARLDHADHVAQMALGALQPRQDGGVGCMQVVLCHISDLTPPGGYDNNEIGRSMVRNLATSAAKAPEARFVVAMMLLLALVFSPVVILSSHGPGAVYLAQQAHVAQQFHGHSHTEDSAGQHDATDHEHPVSAILAGSEKFGFDMHSAVLFHDMPLADGRSRDGPRRPPRVVLI